MAAFSLTHPTAAIARGIEDIVIYGEHSNLFVKGACGVGARAVSIVVFPVFLTLELLFKRIPKMLLAIGTEKFDRKADKSLKFLLSIIPSIVLGIHSPEGVPGFFVKRQRNDLEIRPFGVEKVFGLRLKEGISYPTTPEEVQTIVRDAKKKKQQVAILGAGLSQGTQTVPVDANQCVINTKYLNHIEVKPEENTVTVGAGATWEEVQLALDKANKSAIVKQASDIFSIGGTIGMNAHGWAHQYGPISKTVRSLKVIDANGDLCVLSRPRDGVPEDELTKDELLFKCMFGTLGYFGVVVEATLDIVDNDVLIESTQEIEREKFVQEYEKIKADPTIPLFGGRLVLDTLDGDPLRTICMVSYRRSEDQQGDLAKRKITEEPKWGTRIQRIGLKLISHLSYFSVKRLISYFWQQEKTAMFSGRVVTRNEALHPPINAFKILHHSDLHAQWLQEYFVKPEQLPNFLRFLGAELKANEVRMINATIRPTPKDDISVLPYAEQDRYAVVICFAQVKTEAEMAKTRKWIENVQEFLLSPGQEGVFYQAYMPYATQEQFIRCYGPERVAAMRALKRRFDPEDVFGNAHTAKYYKEVL